MTRQLFSTIGALIFSAALLGCAGGSGASVGTAASGASGQTSGGSSGFTTLGGATTGSSGFTHGYTGHTGGGAIGGTSGASAGSSSTSGGTTGATTTGTATTTGGGATTGGTTGTTGTSGGTTGATTTGTATTTGGTTGTATTTGGTTGTTTTGTATTGGTTGATTTTSTANPGPIYYEETFDGATPKMQLGAWSIGSPTVGPGAPHSGGGCMAVNLHAPSYPDNMSAVAATAPFSLAAATRPILRIFHAHDIEPGSSDAGCVKIQSPTISLQPIDPAYGYSRFVTKITGDVGFCGKSGPAASAPQWIEERFDLSRFAGQADLQIVFEFESGMASTTAYAGWFVDDVEVAEESQLPGGLMAPFSAPPLFRESFDGAAPQLVPSGHSNWQIAAPPPNTHTAPYNYGPGAPVSAPNVAGTNITFSGAQAPAGRYPNNVGGGGGVLSGSGPGDILRTTLPITVPPTATSVTLVFDQYYSLESRYDGGRVIVTKDAQYGIWVPVAPRGGYPMTPLAFSNFQWPNAAFTGAMRGWHRCSIDLTPVLTNRLVGSTFYIGFELASDDSNLAPFAGWYLDDIEVRVR